jgi:hypothetical protein
VSASLQRASRAWARTRASGASQGVVWRRQRRACSNASAPPLRNPPSPRPAPQAAHLVLEDQALQGRALGARGVRDKGERRERRRPQPRRERARARLDARRRLGQRDLEGGAGAGERRRDGVADERRGLLHAAGLALLEGEHHPVPQQALAVAHHAVPGRWGRGGGPGRGRLSRREAGVAGLEKQRAHPGVARCGTGKTDNAPSAFPGRGTHRTSTSHRSSVTSAAPAVDATHECWKTEGSDFDW